MIDGLTRRRQFSGVDDRIVVIHPQWWYIKFTTKIENDLVGLFQYMNTVSIEEVASKPEGSTVAVVLASNTHKFSCDKPGTYEIYFSVKATSNCSLAVDVDTIALRLPNPYAYNGYIRSVYSYSGGTKRTRTDFYITNSTPPVGPNNGALGSNLANNAFSYIHIPKGSLQTYLSNANTLWTTVYNAGRLIEENYKIIED